MSVLKDLLPLLRAYAEVKDQPGYELRGHRWHAKGGGDHLGHLRETYQDAAGLPRTPLTQIKKIHEPFSAAVGAAYDALPTYDPAALPAYEALVKEVGAQAQHLHDAGYRYTLHYDPHEPYSDSHAMRADLHGNGHMHVFATASGFGDEPFEHHYKLENGQNVPIVPEPNPMLQHVPGLSTPERPVLANDLFRFVHDAFGHGIHPHQFGPLGEDNAYREHMTMFSPLAQRALTTETRGQNSWVNFGPHMARPDGTFPKKGEPGFVPAPERRFADQKIALLPEWTQHLGEHTRAYSDNLILPGCPWNWDHPRRRRE